MVKALSDYKQAKDLLLDAAAVLSQIAAERSDQGLGQRISIFCNKIESATFNLAVVGEFKRGKSTLVNALIGDNLLPMAVIPLTSIATIIAYGSRTHIAVRFQNHHSIEITKEELPNYVTESGNPKN